MPTCSSLDVTGKREGNPQSSRASKNECPCKTGYMAPSLCVWKCDPCVVLCMHVQGHRHDVLHPKNHHVEPPTIPAQPSDPLRATLPSGQGGTERRLQAKTNAQTHTHTHSGCCSPTPALHPRCNTVPKGHGRCPAATLELQHIRLTQPGQNHRRRLSGTLAPGKAQVAQHVCASGSKIAYMQRLLL